VIRCVGLYRPALFSVSVGCVVDYFFITLVPFTRRSESAIGLNDFRISHGIPDNSVARIIAGSATRMM